MSSRKKLIITLISACFVIILSIISIVFIFASAKQNVSTNISASFNATDISGEVSAYYNIEGESHVDMTTDGTPNGAKKIVFNAYEATKDMMLQMQQTILTFYEGQSVIFTYNFTNNSDIDYFIKVKYPTTRTNIHIVEATNGGSFTDISSKIANILTVPHCTGEKQPGLLTLKIKLTVIDEIISAFFEGDFKFNLTKERPQLSEEETLSLASLKYEGTDSKGAFANIPTEYKVVGVMPSNKPISGQNMVIIPEVFNGLPVTRINSSSFSNNTAITNVKIGKNIKDIGDNAFSTCTGLQKIFIPDSVTSIGYSAFNNCTGLQTVKISSLVAWCNIDFASDNSNPLYYAPSFLLNDSSLEHLVLPDTISVIKQYAFHKFVNLKDVTIPSSITTIGRNSFAYCNQLTNLVIPEGVSVIEEESFAYCNNLRNVSIPNSITIVEDSFYYCNNLLYNNYDNGKYLGNETNPYIVLIKTIDNNKTTFNIHTTTKVIAGKSIANNSALQNIVIQDSILSIGCEAFNGCVNMRELIIPNNVEYIGREAFIGCRDLYRITIGQSVNHVGVGAFEYCNNIAEVNIIDLSSWCNITFDNMFSNPLSSGIGKLFLNWVLLTEVYIPEGITEIKDFAFYYCQSITALYGSSTIEKIGVKAFYKCQALRIVRTGNSVTTICAESFSGSGLNEITMGSKVKTIQYGAFSGCNVLNRVYVDLSTWCYVELYNLESNPLYYAKQIFNGDRFLYIPNGVTHINTLAFCYLKLQEVHIPSSVNNIYNSAFIYCEVNTLVIESSSIAQNLDESSGLIHATYLVYINKNIKNVYGAIKRNFRWNWFTDRQGYYKYVRK